MSEKLKEAQRRAERLADSLKGRTELSDEEVTLLREVFGRDFLTSDYHLRHWEYLETE